MIESERDKIELKEYKRQLREAAADKREEKTAMKKVDMETETPEIKQLRKFKSLLDQGLITEEDYEKKKQSLLGL